MESPKGPVDIRGWLAPLSSMISSRNLTASVICNKCIIPNYSHPSWHGRVCFNIWKGHLWMIIMNSNMPMRFKLRSGNYIGLQIMFLGNCGPNGVMAIPSISSASGSGSAIGSGGITGGWWCKGIHLYMGSIAYI